MGVDLDILTLRAGWKQAGVASTERYSDLYRMDDPSCVSSSASLGDICGSLSRAPLSFLMRPDHEREHRPWTIAKVRKHDQERGIGQRCRIALESQFRRVRNHRPTGTYVVFLVLSYFRVVVIARFLPRPMRLTRRASRQQCHGLTHCVVIRVDRCFIVAKLFAILI